MALQLDTLAQAAVIEAKRLDEQEAPQREADLRRKQGEDNRVKHEKARRLITAQQNVKSFPVRIVGNDVEVEIA